MSIKTPTNQKRLTNVVVVRLKKTGKRFEIACYPNKVDAWRRKLEKDIDEVLQTHTVFMNVSKGQLAKREDLLSAFRTDDVEAVCLEILANGELQLTERERGEQLEALFHDVATCVADLCVNPDTQQPFAVSIVERAMRDVHIALDLGKSAKQQALKAITKLRANPDVIRIERAQMRLRIVAPVRADKRVRDLIRRTVEDAQIEKDETQPVAEPAADADVAYADRQCTIELLAHPGAFRLLNAALAKEIRGDWRLEIVSLKEIREDLDTEVHDDGP